MVELKEFDESVLRPALHCAVQHYEHYYKAKARWAKHNVLTMFNPSWMTTLENAFLWIGGWRPSMAFHLLYSKSGQQFEARISELIRGVSTGDLGDLSPCQLSQVDELQRKTIREEKDISEKQAKLQETIADSSVVELSHVASELTRGGEAVGDGIDEGRVEATLAAKEEGLVEVLQRADELRMKTLKEILNILTPVQGVHFLIAAAEVTLEGS
ncbi:transcription factor-related [Forsythia ovata]|uniref:Transcription factor-related n=1 Tax=Forsythia ovata TaxID=205694 RepID=A0ABD1UTH8_9LAMI